MAVRIRSKRRRMNSENTFFYTYSAKENEEVLNIRKKYAPQEESKLEELKRLDHQVQSSGVAQALCVGIGGAMFFGLGMALIMEAGSPVFWPGVLLGLVGISGMIAAFPVYRKLFNMAKIKHTPRILQLAEELSGNC